MYYKVCTYHKQILNCFQFFEELITIYLWFFMHGCNRKYAYKQNHVHNSVYILCNCLKYFCNAIYYWLIIIYLCTMSACTYAQLQNTTSFLHLWINFHICIFYLVSHHLRTYLYILTYLNFFIIHDSYLCAYGPSFTSIHIRNYIIHSVFLVKIVIQKEEMDIVLNLSTQSL